jgi:enterochelin esterase family protein
MYRPKRAHAPRFLVPLLGAAGLAGALAAAAPIAAADDDPPAPPPPPAAIVKAYEELARAILSEDLRSFMGVFHFDYIVEASDGRAQDRGPWRRLWIQLFDDWNFESAGYEIEGLLEIEEERVTVRTRQVLVRYPADGGPRRLEENRVEDTWVADGDGAWQLVSRLEGEIDTAGTLPAARAGQIDSPRISALVRGGSVSSPLDLSAFWKETASAGTPLVEEIAGDPRHCWVTFVWRGTGRERSVLVDGGRPSPEGRRKELERLGRTDLWYRTERLAREARFAYDFRVETEVRVPALGERAEAIARVESTVPDPLNPESIDDRSLATLPAAPAIEARDEVEGRPAGEVERQIVESEVLDERRFVTVYAPPDIDTAGTARPAAFLIDQGSYRSRRTSGTVIDNLLAEKRIPSLVVFMIHSEGSRSRALAPNEGLVRFVGEELIAWARARYELSDRPEQTIIGGNGLGGALALACAMRYPGTFGRVLAQNGRFAEAIGSGDPGDVESVVTQLARHPRQELRLFLAVDELEGEPVVGSNRHLRDVLELKGYPATWIRRSANQNSITWQATLVAGLPLLLAD